MLIAESPALKAFKVIRDPRAFEVLADETRRKMIYLLRAKDLSVNQIAEQLDKTPQAIYHQLRKLLDLGMAEIAKEERVGHFLETYYRATAEVFSFSHGEGGGPQVEREAREALEALVRTGLPIQITDDVVGRTVKLLQKEGSIGQRPEIEEKISQIEDLNFLSKQIAQEFAKFMMMTDKQFEEYMGIARELRDLLKSNMAKPILTPAKQHKVNV